jgi:hypothetical protein
MTGLVTGMCGLSRDSTLADSAGWSALPPDVIGYAVA